MYQFNKQKANYDIIKKIKLQKKMLVQKVLVFNNLRRYYNL